MQKIIVMEMAKVPVQSQVLTDNKHIHIKAENLR